MRLTGEDRPAKGKKRLLFAKLSNLIFLDLIGKNKYFFIWTAKSALGATHYMKAACPAKSVWAENQKEQGLTYGSGKRPRTDLF
jgi:hypothetical protein